VLRSASPWIEKPRPIIVSTSGRERSGAASTDEEDRALTSDADHTSPLDLELTALDGPLEMAALRGRAVLVVNVASRCGLTPQYTGLEELQRRYAAAGFSVLGVPCNQFAGQEPGSAEEIATFCSATYGTTFPMTEKLEVNGQRRHPLYQTLTAVPDAQGRAGEVEWNFEKFLISPAGEVVGRFRPSVQPEAQEIVAAIEGLLP
jgi:glutathione peroxidase